MNIEYRKVDVADAELLIDIYNSAFYSDYIKYGECPAYGKTKAMMFYHGTYFKRGVKRVFEELEKLPIEEKFSDMIKRVARSKDVTELRELSKGILLYVENYTRREKNKKEPTHDLTGTYEEMYSNWRNKVAEAAEQDNAVASFINMCNFYYMVAEIGDEVEIGNFNIMELYNPDCLQDNVELFDMCLQKYEDVYKSAGIEVKRFSNVDVFVTNYLLAHNL